MGGRPVREEELLSPPFEACIRWDNPGYRGQVFCQVEGDGRYGDHFVYEGNSRVSESCDGVVSVPRVPGRVWSRTPVEVEEEIRLRGYFRTRYQGGTVRQEAGDGLREACCGGFISAGEQMSLRPARRHWWCIRTGSGGRQASLCKHVNLVEERQLVIHLET